ncbi:tyrosine-type recombinase/integrase [Dellaglioa sp. L3N]
MEINKTKVTFHSLRHSHISYLLANGVDTQYISERSGHDSIATTLKTYSHILSRAKKEQVAKTISLFEEIC